MNSSQTGSRFPGGFLWGTATAAYQIEGSPRADGKGESIWDTFCRVPGAIANGDTGDVACDHYNRWSQDVALMHEMGLDAYRLSVSWPRIFPQGGGALNRPGLDFYDRLTDGLLQAGITPFITLYHWDLPQALQNRGGWANRDSARYFADYARAVGQRLGDRVRFWTTHNEPAVVTFNGFISGDHAPGIKNDIPRAFQVAHNLLLSHGLATEALRSTGHHLQTGITLNLAPMHPASDSSADRDAAALADGLQNRWWLDALFHGQYPADVLQVLGDAAPAVQEGDMQIITAPRDFLGVNHYHRDVVQHDPSVPLWNSHAIKPQGSEYTEMDWEVYPDGLRELLVRLYRDYPAPAYYITENGAAFADALLPDGTVHDARRIAYLDNHFGAAAEAMAAGVPLKGYFIWSLMDNFEWAHGYSKRFGVIYTDYPTQKRIWKDSGRWYQQWIASQK